MTLPESLTPEEFTALRQQPLNEEVVARAIVTVIRYARDRGQTLADLTAEVLQEDRFLSEAQRKTLSDILTQAWNQIV